MVLLNIILVQIAKAYENVPKKKIPKIIQSNWFFIFIEETKLNLSAYTI